jgi:TonB family protein
MALAAGSTESRGSVEMDFPHIDKTEQTYTSWTLDLIHLEIRMHHPVIEALTREIRECPDAETNGVLLGRKEAGVPDVIWIDGFEQLKAAPETWPADTVGFYRGTASPAGFPDSEGPPEGLFLAILPDQLGALTGQFFQAAGEGPSPQLAGPAFPFLIPSNRQEEIAADVRPVSHGRPRRLIPDFDPAQPLAAAPARGILTPRREILSGDEDSDDEDREPHEGRVLRKAAPFLVALALVGGAVWLLPRLISPTTPNAPARVSDAHRPLGLSVDPSSSTWRISWNRDAAMLQGAQIVRLFIHDFSAPESPGQSGIDLSGSDLESGMYPYTPGEHPGGVDLAFRLEATGRDGVVSAETYRLVEKSPSPPGISSVQTPTRVTHRVAPVIASGIRPRIRGKVPIDIRVQIDSKGNVTRATPASRAKNSLERYLARSAVQAAKQWRFEPARRDGKAIAGTQTLHFVFEQ